MINLPNINTTKGLLIWSLFFILLVESVWAISYLSDAKELTADQATSKLSHQTVAAQASPSGEATLSLKGDQTSIEINQTVEVQINLDTKNEETDGATIILTYDPNLLEVNNVNPIQSTNLFPMVLANENENGKITFSAVANPSGPYFKGVGNIAKLNFKAKKAGQANVTFDFQPGSTTDSNIASHKVAGTDILNKVENLTVNIKP